MKAEPRAARRAFSPNNCAARKDFLALAATRNHAREVPFFLKLLCARNRPYGACGETNGTAVWARLGGHRARPPAYAVRMLAPMALVWQRGRAWVGNQGHGRSQTRTRSVVDVRSMQRLASTAPVIAAKRAIEHAVPKGPGGRSSVSGLTVTVFGSTGFLGRYVVARYGASAPGSGRGRGRVGAHAADPGEQPTASRPHDAGVLLFFTAKNGSQVIIPFRGDESDYRHLKVSGDLGQVVPAFYSVRDADRVQRMVDSSDIVVNLVGRDYETSNFSFEDVNIKAAETIARACRQGGVTRLVHVSAAGASPSSASKFLKTKALGEAAVRAEYPAATIVRPSWMFGHEDRFLHRIAFMHMMPTIPGDPVLHDGEAKSHPVYVGDVAEGIVRAGQNSDTAGQTYEFVGYVLGHIEKWGGKPLLLAPGSGGRVAAADTGAGQSSSPERSVAAGRCDAHTLQPQTMDVPGGAPILWRSLPATDPACAVPSLCDQVRRAQAMGAARC